MVEVDEDPERQDDCRFVPIQVKDDDDEQDGQ
jgi:hypothetical protein